MITLASFRKLALSFEGAEEAPHFDRISFRWKGKIFSTYWEKEHYAMVKLSPELQSAFCAMSEVFFPVPGKWGLQGATLVDLNKATLTMVRDALQTAYDGVRKK